LRLVLPLPFDAERVDPPLRPLPEPLPFDELRLEEPLLLRLEDEPPLAVEPEDLRLDDEPLAFEAEDLRLDDEPLAFEAEDLRLDDAPLDFDPEDLRLDDEPPRADDFRLDDEPPLALEDELRLLARDRDDDFLRPDDELDDEDFTLPSLISPRQAPVASSSISTYAL
jgi:hypothetical protein